MSGQPLPVRRPLAEPGAVGRAWRWALGVTAAVATIVACLFPAAGAIYAARAERDAARAPHFMASAFDPNATTTPPGAVALFASSGQTVDDRPVSVLWLENLDPSAAPPPGLDRWPGPHQVIASPGLLATPDGRELAQRDGTLVGTISDAGLVNPKEKLLYAGIDPTIRAVGANQAIDGFGAPAQHFSQDENGHLSAIDVGYAGDTQYQWSRSAVRTTLVLFALAPCLVMIGVVARLGGERRDQYAAWLAMIGASPWRIRRFLLRESAAPIGLGCLAGLAVLALASIGDWTIPGFGAVIVGPDLRAAWAQYLAWALGAGAVIQLAVWAVHRLRRTTLGASPRVAGGRSRPWLVFVLIGLVVAQGTVYTVLNRTDPGAAATYSAFFAAATIVLLAPCGGALLALVASATLRIGCRRGSPAALVTARELGALPRPALRTSAVIAAAVVVTVQAVLMLSGPGTWVASARAGERADPGLAVRLTESGDPDTWLPRADAGLPSTVALVSAVHWDAMRDVPEELRATCTQIEHFGVPCPTTATTVGALVAHHPEAAQQALARTVPLDTPVEPVAALTRGSGNLLADGELLVLSTTGERVDQAKLYAELGRLASPAPALAGTKAWWGSLVGGASSVDNARWLLVAGAVAGIILLLAAAAALIFEALRVARRMASLAMMSDRPGITNALGVGLIGIPLLTATVLGDLVALGLSIAPTSAPGTLMSMPWAYFVALLGAGAVLSLVAGLATARVIRGHGSRWAPATGEP